MKMFYYYIDSDGVTLGPVDIEYFKEFNINGNSWVWYEGLPQWVNASTISEIQNYTKDNLPVSFSTSTRKDVVDITKENYNTPNKEVISDEEIEELHSTAPKTWLLESILITVLCCMPFGIVGIIYGSRVGSYWSQGLYAESLEASNKAGFWVRLAVMVTVILWLIYLALWLFTPVAEETTLWYNNYFTSSL